jgi:DNA excision repair protein ERCC-4
VDDRERGCDVPRMLTELGINIKFSQLSVGDYVISPNVAIERKSLRDFISSLYDGRLFKQVYKLAEVYENGILLIEGDLSQLPLLTSNVKSFFGALAALILDSPTKTVFVEGPEESALFIKSLAIRVHSKREKEKLPLIYKPYKGSDIAERQLYFISALPGIGVKLAHRLLTHFSTPAEIIKASPSELSKVPGLGRVKAKKLHKFLNLPHKKALKERRAQKSLMDI